MHIRQFSHTIRLRDVANDIISATLTCESRDYTEGRFRRRDCTIRLTCDRGQIDGSGGDFFDAFCAIRQALAPLGLIPLCYGASRNVYPSGMARDMAAGERAYKLRLGQPVTGNDIVDIFAEGPDIEPATVDAQRAFWEQCLKSLGNSRSRD